MKSEICTPCPQKVSTIWPKKMHLSNEHQLLARPASAINSHKQFQMAKNTVENSCTPDVIMPSPLLSSQGNMQYSLKIYIHTYLTSSAYLNRYFQDTFHISF
jgi:hypothetical protein